MLRPQPSYNRTQACPAVLPAWGPPYPSGDVKTLCECTDDGKPMHWATGTVLPWGQAGGDEKCSPPPSPPPPCKEDNANGEDCLPPSPPPPKTRPSPPPPPSPPPMPPPMPPVAAPPSDCNCSEVQAELEAKLKDMEERLANETKLRAAELKAMEERTEAALEAIRQFILMTPPSTPPPLPSPPPPQRPVECGRPGVCSETPGLRDPNELHEVRACTQPNPSHACALYAFAHRARPYPFGQVRCCSNVKLSPAWGSLQPGCSVWGASDAGWPCTRDQTFAQAEAICQAAGARLCTAAELVAGCTAGTGCGFDLDLVWGI